jgi:site-specific DNA-methyltransferase (adenine-specific)
MDYMAGLEDNAFDLAIVDPPYRDQNQPTKEMRSASKKTNSKRFVKTEILGKKPTIDFYNELIRVSKEQIIFGCNNFDFPPYKGFVVWEKTNIPENFTMSMAEIASLSEGLSTTAKIFRETSNRGGFSIHPTQKPVSLYDFLLKHYSKKSDKILDTHLGSGSSAIAAHYGGFDFVGCELDQDYYNAAMKRFDNETRQIDLLGEL